jgi:hypothetical protein
MLQNRLYTLTCNEYTCTTIDEHLRFFTDSESIQLALSGGVQYVTQGDNSELVCSLVGPGDRLDVTQTRQLMGPPDFRSLVYNGVNVDPTSNIDKYSQTDYDEATNSFTFTIRDTNLQTDQGSYKCRYNTSDSNELSLNVYGKLI